MTVYNCNKFVSRLKNLKKQDSTRKQTLPHWIDYLQEKSLWKFAFWDMFSFMKAPNKDSML